MKLIFSKTEYVVCKLSTLPNVVDGEFCLARTDGELSLVCKAGCQPQNAVSVEGGWCGFRVDGELDFALIGIISGITAVLAQEKIAVFVVSTFDTDYFLVKQEKSKAAARALRAAGFEVTEV